mgnify:CR=1 FL=1
MVMDGANPLRLANRLSRRSIHRLVQHLMIGPKITIKASCYNCEHCRTERYCVQGDSGTDVRCAAAGNKLVGDTCWDTPEWCPFIEEAKLASAQSLLSD